MVAAAIAVLTTGLYVYFSNEQLKSIESETAYIEQGLSLNGTKYLDNLSTPERVTLIAPDGTVIADTAEDPATLDNHLDRAEVQEALENGTGQSIRQSGTLAEKTVNYAILLDNGNILRVSVQEESIFQIFMGLTQFIVLAIVATFVISYFVAKELSKRILKPISRIDLDHPLETQSYPEFSPFLRKIAHQDEQISEQAIETRRMQNDFETITNNMTEGMIILSRNGKIISYNQSALDLFGLRKLNEGDYALVLDRSPEFRALMKRLLDGKGETLHQEVDGRMLEVIASPVRDGDETSGAVLIIIDETEKAQREQLRAQYVTNISHELKTPLTSILGYAEIMKSGMVEAKDVPNFSEKIYDEAGHMITMVEDILNIGRLDEEKGKGEQSMINLEDLVQIEREKLEKKMRERGIEMTVLCKGDSDMIGNFSALDEVVVNLLDNAIKYNREGGRVDVEIDGRIPDEIVLSVEDTGIGIKPAEKERIFERFYRADESRSKEIRGTGLGLSIVKHAVQLHDGEINIDSVPGEGTTITIRFPRKLPQTQIA